MILPARHLAAAALAAVLCLAAAAPGADAAGRRKGVFEYGVYIGGFRVLEMKIDTSIAGERYDTELFFTPTGWLGPFFPWKMSAYSRGRLGDAAVRPERAGDENYWEERRRWIALRFEADRPIVTGGNPMPVERGPLLVPEEMRRDTMDLVAAIMTITSRMDGGACPARVPVYDGHSRYDLMANPLGRTSFAGSGYSAFRGEAMKCRVLMRRIKGFKKPDSFPQLNSRHPLTVWVGRPFAELPPQPVRFELDSPWGTIIIHLVKARMKNGKVTRSLSAGR